MVLESTMICLDNSEWMRNGDYHPTRLEAQQDAASIICTERTGSNRENTVGILTMAGNGVDLLVSPTEDVGKILACFARIRISGKSNFTSAVQIAQLALKHRKNKNGGQRIIAFVGSPILEELPALQKIGKQLKKNNVAIDIISLGDQLDNNEKLTEFVKCANSNDNCHLIAVPPGVLPADAIVSSPIMHGEGGAGMGLGGGGGGGGGGGFDDLGFDPSMDPELAMAIRTSTEEARRAAEAQAQAAMQASASEGSGGGAQSSSSAVASSASPFGGASAADFDEEEALLQRALELSMQDLTTQDAGSGDRSSEMAVDSAAANAMDDDEALRRAFELSMSTPLPTPAPAPAAAAAAAPASTPSSAVNLDFVSQLLGQNNVDQNDPLILAALAQMSGGVAPPQPPSEDSSSNNNEGENNRKRKGDDAK